MAMTLLLGGAASGKSRTAAALAAGTGLDVTVIATGEALDDEMAARIDRHRRERPDDWTVIEEPLDLVGGGGAGPTTGGGSRTRWTSSAPSSEPAAPRSSTA